MPSVALRARQSEVLIFRGFLGPKVSVLLFQGGYAAFELSAGGLPRRRWWRRSCLGRRWGWLSGKADRLVGHDHRGVLLAFGTPHRVGTVGRGCGDLSLSAGFSDVPAVEAHPPPHDLVLRFFELLQQLPCLPESLVFAPGDLGVGLLPCPRFFGPLLAPPVGRFALLLVSVVPSGELVVLQGNAAALVLDLRHERTVEPAAFNSGAGTRS